MIVHNVCGLPIGTRVRIIQLLSPQNQPLTEYVFGACGACAFSGKIGTVIQSQILGTACIHFDEPCGAHNPMHEWIILNAEIQDLTNDPDGNY